VIVHVDVQRKLDRNGERGCILELAVVGVVVDVNLDSEVLENGLHVIGYFQCGSRVRGHGADHDNPWCRLVVLDLDITSSYSRIRGSQPQPSRSRLQSDFCTFDLIPTTGTLDLNMTWFIDVDEV
jgi:hypothetical protein